MKTRRDWGSNAGKGLSHTRNRGSAVKTTSTCTPREGYRSVPLPRTPARCRWEQSLMRPPGEATWQGLAHRMASVPGGSPRGGAAPWQQVYPGGASLRPQQAPAASGRERLPSLCVGAVQIRVFPMKCKAPCQETPEERLHQRSL